MTDEPYDYGELLVVQHHPLTGPSALGEVLDARAGKRPWRLVDAPAGAPFPALDGVRGIIVLGGPQGVPDRDAHPWMDAELDALRTANERAIPVFGICLGAQLLATTLGGEVAPRPTPEVGFLPLKRTEAALDDPVFAGWPDGAAVAFLHDDDVVSLPDGAEPMLEGSDAVAAWRAPVEGSYGVLFHPEVDGAQLAAWTQREENRARFEAAGVSPERFAEEATRRNRFLRAFGLGLLGRWVDAVVGKGDPDPKRGRRAGR